MKSSGNAPCHGQDIVTETGSWRNRAAVARPEILPVAVSDPPLPARIDPSLPMMRVGSAL